MFPFVAQLILQLFLVASRCLFVTYLAFGFTHSHECTFKRASGAFSLMSLQPSAAYTKAVDYYSPQSPPAENDATVATNAADAPPANSQPQWPPHGQSQQGPPASSSSPPQRTHGRGAKSGADEPANRYADPNDIPVNLNATKYRHRPWHYSLCVCCQEMDSCAEACCCMYCQLSRQCNMFMYNERKIHWPYCVLMTLTDLCTGHLIVTWVFASQTRRLSRERYGISGSCCNDCCAGCWCRTCSTQQVLLEMTVMNDFPGATCYNAVPQPMDFEMV